MRAWVRTSARLIGPLVFLGVIWMTDLSQVGRIWKQGESLMLGAAAGINGVIILVKAWRNDRTMRWRNSRSSHTRTSS